MAHPTDEEFLARKQRRLAKLMARHDGQKYTAALREARTLDIDQVRSRIADIHSRNANQGENR